MKTLISGFVGVFAVIAGLGTTSALGNTANRSFATTISDSTKKTRADTSAGMKQKILLDARAAGKQKSKKYSKPTVMTRDTAVNVQKQ